MINAYQAGLVFKNGVYQRLLTEGKYWIGFGEKLELYQRTQPFTPAMELNLLLKDEKLKEALHVVEVKDNEIVLQYENGLLKQVLTPGRYTYWKGFIVYEFVTADIGKIEITENLDRTTLMGKAVAGFVRTYSVEAYEKAVLFIDGKYARTLESGFYCWWKNSISIYVGKVDTRLQQAELNGQEILTRDKASLRINAWARYQVVDVEKALLQNKEYDRQLYVAFQLALREYITGLNFDELLEKKDAIVAYVLEKVAQEAETLGVRVAGFGIRDIVLPGDIKEIMNQVLVAEKVSTISVNGNGVLIDQLRQIFGGGK